MAESLGLERNPVVVSVVVFLLGLAIIKSICAAHGGRVRFESEEGKGSRFRVELLPAPNSAVEETGGLSRRMEGGTHE